MPLERWITDNEPSPTYPIYTRANAGEVCPDPMSPLFGTFGMMKASELGWQDAYVSGGTFDREEFDADQPNCVGSFGGYLYLNMSMTRIFGVRAPGMTPEMVDFQYFGEMPGIPPYQPRPTDESPRHTEALSRLFGWFLTAEALPELVEDQSRVEEVVGARPDLAALSPAELVARARAMIPHWRSLFERHIIVSSGSGVGLGTVAGVCAAIGRPELTMQLAAATGGVDSAAPSWEMWDLSRRVRSSKRLTSAFDGGVDGLEARLRAADDADCDAFLSSFADFLRRYGSRGPNEWELRSDTWGTRPELALAAVDRMRLADDDASPRLHTERLAAQQHAAAAEVEAALAGNDEARAQFGAGLRCARVFLPGRERTKTNNIRIVHEARLAFRQLGRRMAEAGHLAHLADVFMLTDEELDDFVADPASFTSVVQTRAAAVKPGTTLTGIPGCPGKATGRARVVLDPSHPQALEPGDVLIAPITDPSWTPLFVPAAAVVVNVGAQITHAVIVSRELGIPCVVSVTDATNKVPDGAMVTVDGTQGTVTVH